MEALIGAACIIEQRRDCSEFDGHFGVMPVGTTRSGHAVHRHWPGEGRVPMAVVVLAGLCRHTRSTQWRGRARRLAVGCHSNDTVTEGHSISSMAIVGLHGANSEMAAETLRDVVTQ